MEVVTGWSGREDPPVGRQGVDGQVKEVGLGKMWWWETLWKARWVRKPGLETLWGMPQMQAKRDWLGPVFVEVVDVEGETTWEVQGCPHCRLMLCLVRERWGAEDVLRVRCRRLNWERG